MKLFELARGLAWVAVGLALGSTAWAADAAAKKPAAAASASGTKVPAPPAAAASSASTKKKARRDPGVNQPGAAGNRGVTPGLAGNAGPGR